MDTQIIEILKCIQSDISGMKNEISSINNEISGMKNEISGMKKQLDENTQILKALEHSAEINKAEHDKMSNDIAKLKAVK